MSDENKNNAHINVIEGTNDVYVKNEMSSLPQSEPISNLIDEKRNQEITHSSQDTSTITIPDAKESLVEQQINDGNDGNAEDTSGTQNSMESHHYVEVKQLSPKQKKDMSIDELVEYVYNKYKDEQPVEWRRSLSFFYGPAIFFICCLCFIFMQKPTWFIIFTILLMNFLYTSYNTLQYLNQRIYVYSTKLVIHYGLLSQNVREFIYGSDDMAAIKAGIPQNMLQKRFNYGNFYLQNNLGLAFTIHFVQSPDGFREFLTDKIVNFNREFDPDYTPPPVEVIKSSGVYIQDENGNLIKKNHVKKDDISNQIVQH